MQTWKDFLEQDKEYDSIDLHITMAEDLASQEYIQRIETIDHTFNGIECCRVVSVISSYSSSSYSFFFLLLDWLYPNLLISR
jgi:hypothetical protein